MRHLAILTKRQYVSSLKNKAIHDQYGKYIDVFQGKNVQALFKYPPASMSLESYIERTAYWTAWPLLIDIALGELEPEEGLDIMEQEINRVIDAEE